MKRTLKLISMPLTSVITVFIVTTLFFTSVFAATTRTVVATGTYYQTDARSCLSLINSFRHSNDAWYWGPNNTKVVASNLSTLTYDYALEQIAMQRVMESAAGWSHTRPDETNYNAYTYNGVTTRGECLAIGAASANSAYTLWREDNEPYGGQGHRIAMLNSRYNAVGIAHVEVNGVHYYALEFGYANSGAAATTALNGSASRNVVISERLAKLDATISSAVSVAYGSSVTLPSVRLEYGIQVPSTWIGGNYGRGVPVPDSQRTISWRSNNTSVVTISGNSVVGVAPGSATLTMTATAYGKTVTKTVNVTVTTASISSATVTIPDQVYNGGASTPAVTVKLGTKTLVAGTDYTVTYSNNTSVTDSARVTITGTGKYSGTVRSTFKITQANLSACTMTINTTSYEYTGSVITPSITIKQGSKVLTRGTDYTITCTAVNAGTATFTVTGNGNYTGTKIGSFTITAVSLTGATVTVTNSTAIYYTGSPVTPNVSVRIGTRSIPLTEFNITYSNNIAVGTSATVTLTGKGNYSGTLTATFEIKRANITASCISIPQTSYTYTGTAICPVPVVTVSGKTLVKDVDYTVSYANNTFAGTARITVTGMGNYASSGTKTFTIAYLSRTLTSANVSLVNGSAYNYTGGAVTPEVRVVYNGTTLAPTIDYVVSYTDNTAVGTGTVTVRGVHNYSGTITKTFTINAFDLQDATCTLGYTTATFTGSELRPSVTVRVNNTNVSSTNYTVTYSNNINAGTATVTVTGKGNYSGTITRTFTITPLELNSTTRISGVSNQIYTGSEITFPNMTVVHAMKSLVLNRDFTAEYLDNIDAGTATITITGIGNYRGSVSTSFTITTIDLSRVYATVSGVASKPYIGSPVTQPDMRVVVNYSTTLVEGVDYSVTYSPNVNVGVVTITITGMGRYSGSVTATFSITAASISSATISGVENMSYTGSEVTQSGVVVTLGTKQLVYGTDYTISYERNTNVGVARMYIRGTGNYTGTKYVDFSIGGISISDATVSGVTDATYTGSQIYVTGFEVKVGETVLDPATDYVVSYANNINLGTASITIRGTGNYTDSIIVTFRINPCPISGATVTGITNQTYTGSQIVPYGISVNIGSRVLRASTDYTITYSNNVNPGTATVTITGKGNYSGTLTRTFTINRVDISGLVVSGIRSYTYTGSEITQPSMTLTWNRTALTLGTDYTVSYSNNINAGTASMTITGCGKFSGTVTKTFFINPRLIYDATMSGFEQVEYTGSPVTLDTINITYNSMTLVEGVDYTLEYANNTAPGLGRVLINGIGNYTDSTTRQFMIYQEGQNSNVVITPVPGEIEQGEVVTPTTTPVYPDIDYPYYQEPVPTVSPVVTPTGVPTRPSVETIWGSTTIIVPTQVPTTMPVQTPSQSPMQSPSQVPESSESGVGGFVERLYTIALERPSDPNGKADWVNRVYVYGATGADVAQGFLFSPEFLGKDMSNEEFLGVLYRVFFDRVGDQGGVNYWLGQMAVGMDKQTVIWGFINSTEWANVCLRFGIASGGNGVANISVGTSAEIIDFATRLYTTCLGREADQVGLMDWATRLANRQISGSTAAAGFFTSSEFVDANYENAEYINRLYRTFMGREADQGGFDYWMGRFAEGATREDVFNGFAGSQEWAGICSSYGILK